MDTLIFNAPADNVGIDILDKIKAVFGSQQVTIRVRLADKIEKETKEK